MEKLLTIEEIFSPGHQVQIIFSKYIGSVQTIAATVTAFKKEGLFLAVQTPDLADLLEPGAEIEIQYENTDGQKYLFSSYQIALASDKSPNLIVAKPWKINYALLSRYFNDKVDLPWKVNCASLRRFLRVEVDLPFYYQLEGNVHIGRVIDLSVSGLFAVVQPEPQFLLGSSLAFQLKLPNAEAFKLTGEIVRSQTIEQTKLGIGIDFSNVGPEVREGILNYLSQQRSEAT